MIADESLANITRVIEHLESNDPYFRVKPPVVAAPQWWIDEVKQACADKMVAPTDEIMSIAGCRLLLQVELQEPFVISGGGKTYPVLPAYARASRVGREPEKLKPVDSIFRQEPPPAGQA